MILLKTNFKHLLVASTLLLIASPTFADDGLTPGPGVFSGASGEYSLVKLIKLVTPRTADTNVAQEPYKLTTVNVKKRIVASSGDQKEIADYQVYQEWPTLRDANPELYTDFEMYLDYKAFLEQQAEQ